MLGHLDPDRGQVKHLSPFHTHLRGTGQIGPTPTARARFVTQGFGRVADLRQCRARMTCLPTRFAPTAATQRFRGRFRERRVRRGRLRGVRRVLPELALQLRNLGPQRHDQSGELVMGRTLTLNRHTKIIPPC
jgi:hypothetical protein